MHHHPSGAELGAASSTSSVRQRAMAWSKAGVAVLVISGCAWLCWRQLTATIQPGYYLRLTLGLLLLMLVLELVQLASLRALPQAQTRIKTYFGWSIEGLAWFAIASTMRLSWLLPAYDASIAGKWLAAEPLRTVGNMPMLRVLVGPVGSSTTFIKITVYLLVLLIVLETHGSIDRTVRHIRWSRPAVHVVKLLAIGSAALVLVLLPAPFVPLRNVVLASLVFCGGLTLWRQFRRRWRTGDRSIASLMGGFSVVAQFLGLVVLVGGLLATVLTMPLWAVLYIATGASINRPPLSVLTLWLQHLAGMMLVLGFFYCALYALRRFVGAHGLSWLDPPNFRVAWRDALYDATERVDHMRGTFVRYVVGDPSSGLHTAIDAAARILPVLTPQARYTFTVIGDPGEGDDSQLYALRSARTNLLQQAVGSSTPTTAAPVSDQTLTDQHVDLDFVILSSDVVYPAGELMDYERAVYRPFRTNGPHAALTHAVPMYAIPGNHDWYNDLRGFWLNFAYLAAHETHDAGSAWRHALAHGPWAGNAALIRTLRWGEVRRLRERYGLHKLGGVPGEPRTQQRLPFFEMNFADVGAPLTIVGVDTGCTGSIDPLQFAWLERCLARARDQFKLVLLSAPLYVDGKFNNTPMYVQLYTLLRAHHVDVVMSGDTHSYQRYTVHYTVDEREHVMHHVVNGGGGAYLSPPVDLDWEYGYAGRPLPLDPRFVFHDEAARPDQVTLHDLFPHAALLRAKFGPQHERIWDRDNGQQWRNRLRARYEALVLRRGLTNFLEHDRAPLLQSFVQVQLRQHAAGWTLVLTPQHGQDLHGNVPQVPVAWMPSSIRLHTMHMSPVRLGPHGAP